MEKPSVGDRGLQGKGRRVDFHKIAAPKDEEEILDAEAFFFDVEEDDLQECLVNLPPLDEEMHNPVTISNIINHQSKDVALIQMVLKDPDHFSHQTIQQKDVIAFHKNPEDRNAWKIVIPNTLVKDVMQWYHVKLGHAGIERLATTVGTRFHISNLRARAEEAIHNCPSRCQQFKPVGKGYGHLPPKVAGGSPWDEIAVDLVGPWKIELNT